MYVHLLMLMCARLILQIYVIFAVCCCSDKILANQVFHFYLIFWDFILKIFLNQMLTIRQNGLYAVFCELKYVQIFAVK